MAAIAAESGPIIQGGFALRGRSGEDGLSRLTEIGVPIEGYFSPFYTGTVRLQAVPTYLTAGTPGVDALLRFGKEAQLALVPGTTLASLPLPGSQNATGVSLNVGYAYQMFAGEIGTTPLGFPVENLVGRLALMWPGPATLTTAYPRIPPVPTTVTKPLQIRLEGVRQAVTDSLLSYAGTKDPVSGLVWGGVIKTGGDLLVSYDDGDFGVYGGGGLATIDGKSVASNSEVEGIVGAYIRPWRTANQAFKVGLNLNYMSYDKNLRFFTFGQGGYFSPQNYLNASIPLEYTGQYGRLSWLAAAALGIQTFHENSSPFFPTDPGKQNALQAAFGSAASYPARNVTGPSFNINGQLEYQLDNGFSFGGLAGINNAQNFTEGVGKVYLRKSFGLLPAASFLPRPLAGSL
jgi:cellulose synthase operon protein C